ncbi:hypothetical protein [Alteromonas sp. a30]|uniref:hypothetical protein n=1 Tax=Alteromonas sp. a30 TaxID=2730917 RepID=UPI00227E78B7|nr:hypothetical protein [Alteromonas sp. a30]MCY7295842.1 hypothetical protein [Alteromonas sp. a30]
MYQALHVPMMMHPKNTPKSRINAFQEYSMNASICVVPMLSHSEKTHTEVNATNGSSINAANNKAEYFHWLINNTDWLTLVI